MQNKQKLREAGLHDVYYHIRFRDGSGYTVCLVLDKEGGLLARGIAICSRQDQFNRRTGRTLALGRAMQAIAHKDCIQRIHKPYVSNIAKVSASGFIWKASYLPNLTSYEMRTVFKEKEKVGV